MNFMNMLRWKRSGSPTPSPSASPVSEPSTSPSDHYRENEVSDEVKGADPVWLTEIDPNDLVVFVHIPKAAGTSLNAILWQVYGRRYINYHRKLSPKSVTDRIMDEADDILALGGHMPHGFHRSFRKFHGGGKSTSVFGHRNRRYITVLRNPIDRMKSYYRFVTTFPAHHLYAETRHMRPDEFFRHMQVTKNPECSELQCRLVGRSRHYETARDYLASNYHAVGVVDRVDDFIHELQKTLNWPRVFEMKRRNVSPATVEDDEFGPDVIDWITKHNEADLKLYEFAKRELAPGR